MPNNSLWLYLNIYSESAESGFISTYVRTYSMLKLSNHVRNDAGVHVPMNTDQPLNNNTFYNDNRHKNNIPWGHTRMYVRTYMHQ